MASYKTLRLFGVDIIPAPNDPEGQEINFPAKSAAPSSSQITLQEEHGDEENKKNKKKKKKKKTASKKTKSFKRRRANIDDLPIPSLDGFPIQEKITLDGIRPVFLYRKWIEKSDVDRSLGRLFLSRSEGMMDTLTKEERDVVMSGEGLDIPGFDSDGRVYTFHCTKWTTQSQPNLSKKTWNQVVRDNGVEPGQMIEIWGDRRDGKPLLIVNFRKAEGEGESSGVGSSGVVATALGNSPTEEEAVSRVEEEEDGARGWGRKKARGSNNYRAQSV